MVNLQRTERNEVNNEEEEEVMGERERFMT